MSGVGETTIGFAPLLPWSVLIALALPAGAILAYALWRRARGILWRTLALTVLFAVLANPTFIKEKRNYLPNIAVVVVDDSPSQHIGKRQARTEAAVQRIRKEIGALPGIELRVVHAGGAEGGSQPDGTHLFSALDRALSEVPNRRLAGVLMVTDGQVHDVPANPGETAIGDAPFHVLLTGDRDEGDRRLVLRQAPSYGIVGKELSMTVRVEDLGSPGGGLGSGETTITIDRNGKKWRTEVAPVGRDFTIRFRLERPGPTYFEIEAEKGPRELTLENNRVVAAVNGVRDRLRVLLISGEPHPGERTWRNLLKADPSVDLVHFTILRPPDKQDRTPVSELSLISFPVHELFDVKLNQFDLIIFDRYRRRGVLLSHYLENIADYVDKGGALLVAVGPSFADSFSLFNTPLGRVLPGVPTGRVLVGGFRPRVTEIGRRHPVTADLPGAGAPAGAAGGPKDPKWGRWFRTVEVDPLRGVTLMSGLDDRPLLILEREGKGRVAQILSDHMWLWSRGFEGGGPQAELLRRTAHWLMKEPELEENSLSAEARGGRLHIERRSLKPDHSPVEVTAPSGATETVQLKDQGDGRSTGSVPIRETGVWRASDGNHTALAAAGRLNPVEVADMRTTASRLKPVVDAHGGGVIWLADAGAPELREVQSGHDLSGQPRLGRPGWLGLRAEKDYVVTGVNEVSLLPGLLALLAGLGALLLAWRREGD